MSSSDVLLRSEATEPAVEPFLRPNRRSLLDDGLEVPAVGYTLRVGDRASLGCRWLRPLGLDGMPLSARMYSVVGDDDSTVDSVL